MRSKKEMKDKIKGLEEIIQKDGFLSDYNQGLMDGFKWVLQLLHPLSFHVETQELEISPTKPEGDDIR